MDITKYPGDYQIIRHPGGYTVTGPDGSSYECKIQRGAELSIRHHQRRGCWPPIGAM